MHLGTAQLVIYYSLKGNTTNIFTYRDSVSFPGILSVVFDLLFLCLRRLLDLSIALGSFFFVLLFFSVCGGAEVSPIWMSALPGTYLAGRLLYP